MCPSFTLFPCSYISVREFFHVCLLSLKYSHIVCCGDSDAQGGETALMLAAAYGHADCVRLLIDAGADKEAKNIVRSLASVFADFAFPSSFPLEHYL
jgi:hypothetical protein